MFDTFNGLPLHALVVHGAVVLIPLSGLLGVLFAVPRTRSWARWPLPLVSVAALGSVIVAIQSGQVLRGVLQLDTDTGGDPAAALVERHSELAEQLLWIMLAYTVVAVAAALLAGPVRHRRRPQGSPSGDASTGHEAADRSAAGRQPVAVGLSVLLVVGSVVIGAWTYRVGSLGAKAVWNPTDSSDYSDLG